MADNDVCAFPGCTTDRRHHAPHFPGLASSHAFVPPSPPAEASVQYAGYRCPVHGWHIVAGCTQCVPPPPPVADSLSLCKHERGCAHEYELLGEAVEQHPAPSARSVAESPKGDEAEAMLRDIVRRANKGATSLALMTTAREAFAAGRREGLREAEDVARMLPQTLRVKVARAIADALAALAERKGP